MATMINQLETMSIEDIFLDEQDMALSNHIILFYDDKDIIAYKNQKNTEKNRCCILMCLIVSLSFIGVSIVGIILPEQRNKLIAYILLFVGIILLLVSIFNKCNSKIILFNTISNPNYAYSYYCYDTNDQSIKLIIVNKKTRKVVKTPNASNLGDINDIQSIKCINYGMDTAEILLTKVGTKQPVSLCDIEIIGNPNNFCFEMTQKIGILKQFGLDNVKQYMQHTIRKDSLFISIKSSSASIDNNIDTKRNNSDNYILFDKQ